MSGHDKYVTTSDFNKCLNTIFDQRLKQGKLATSYDYNNVEQHSVKEEQKIEQLKTIDFLYSW